MDSHEARSWVEGETGAEEKKNRSMPRVYKYRTHVERRRGLLLGSRRQIFFDLTKTSY